MRSIKLTLRGVPPSLNRFAGRENAWQYRAEKERWTNAVQWAIKAQGCKPPRPFDRAAVTIDYFFRDARRRDPDNYSGKLLLDGLTRGGVIVDDSFSHITLTVTGAVDKKSPRTEIIVRGVESSILSLIERKSQGGF